MSVRVLVEFMGPILRPPGAGNEAEITFDDPATVGDLLANLGYRPVHQRHLGVFRDGRRLPRTAALVDGERLTVATPMGGG